MISNGVNYTLSGGHLAVELQCLPKAKKQILKTQKGELGHPSQNSGVIFRDCQNLKNDCLKVTVKDNGMGITTEALSSLFDPFDRVDLPRTHGDTFGSGLGLAIALAIV